MPETKIQTREQVLAQLAYKEIAKVENSKDKEKLGREFKHLPSLIHQCGLCQALAFLESKKHKDVITNLETVMGIQELEEKSRNAEVIEYMQLTREAMMAAQWLKRYTDAFGLCKE